MRYIRKKTRTATRIITPRFLLSKAPTKATAEVTRRNVTNCARIGSRPRSIKIEMSELVTFALNKSRLARTVVQSAATRKMASFRCRGNNLYRGKKRDFSTPLSICHTLHTLTWPDAPGAVQEQHRVMPADCL